MSVRRETGCEYRNSRNVSWLNSTGWIAKKYTTTENSQKCWASNHEHNYLWDNCKMLYKKMKVNWNYLMVIWLESIELRINKRISIDWYWLFLYAIAFNKIFSSKNSIIWHILLSEIIPRLIDKGPKNQVNNSHNFCMNNGY